MNYDDTFNLTSYDTETFRKSDLSLNNNYMSIQALHDENNLMSKDNLGTLKLKLFSKTSSFQKLIPIPNILGINVSINNVPLNLSSCRIISYKETLHMKNNIVVRETILEDGLGRQNRLCIKKLLSTSLKEIYCISYSITPLNYNGLITFTPFIDFSNISIPLKKIYGDICSKCGVLAFLNPKENYILSSAIRCELHEGYFKQTSYENMCCTDNLVSYTLKGHAVKNIPLTLFKYVSLTNGFLKKKDQIITRSKTLVKNACVKNFDTLFNENMR